MSNENEILKKNTYALQCYFKHTCILDVLFEIVALKNYFLPGLEWCLPSVFRTMFFQGQKFSKKMGNTFKYVLKSFHIIQINKPNQINNVFFPDGLWKIALKNWTEERQKYSPYWLVKNSLVGIWMFQIKPNNLLTTAVCAGFVRLSIPMGNQFSTANLAMVGPILMIPTADPHDILIPIQHWKKSTPSTSVRACGQLLHYTHSFELRFY